jgi:hypothetical protein
VQLDKQAGIRAPRALVHTTARRCVARRLRTVPKGGGVGDRRGGTSCDSADVTSAPQTKRPCEVSPRRTSATAAVPRHDVAPADRPPNRPDLHPTHL